MAEHVFMTCCPDEDKAAFDGALAQQPAVTRGPILDFLHGLRNSNIPITQLLALIPLIGAAFTPPFTGVIPLMEAVAALIKQYHPTPAPA